jgi:hypothetical protein
MKLYTSYGAYFSRGVVVTLMVYGHISFIGTSLVFQEHLYELLHSFRMPVLIFLTGFFLNLGKSSEVMLKNSLRYIVVPYLIFEISYVFVHYLSNYFGLVNTNTGPIESVLGFFYTIFLKPTGPFWFLYYLAVIQVFVGLLKFISEIKSNIPLHFSVSLIFPFLVFLNIVTVDFVVFYTLGMFFRKWSDDIYFNPLVSIVFISLFFYLGAASMDAEYILRIPFVLSVIFVLFWMASLKWFAYINKFFIHVGANSMSVLCWHAFIIVLFRPLDWWFLGLDASGVLYVFVVTVFGVLGSILLTRVSDFLNFSRYFFGFQKAYKSPPFAY